MASSLRFLVLCCPERSLFRRSIQMPLSPTFDRVFLLVMDKNILLASFPTESLRALTGSRTSLIAEILGD